MVLLNELPLEILEKIFAYTDGITLGYLGRASYRFYIVVKSLKCSLTYWRETCLRDIDQDILEDMMMTIIPEPKSYQYWQTLFKSCHRADYVSYCERLKTPLPSKKIGQPIGIKIQGDYAYTIHRAHRIVKWDAIQGVPLQTILTTNTGNLAASILPKLHLIYHDSKHITLVSVANQWIYLNSTENKGKQKCIKAAHNEPISDCSVFGTILVSCSKSHIAVGRCSVNKDDQVYEPLHKLVSIEPLSVCVWDHQVLSAGLDRNLQLWDLDNIPDITVHSYKTVTQISHYVPWIILRNTIKITVFADVPGFSISVNDSEFKHYNTLNVLQASPSRVLLKGNLLVLAMVTGSVYIYYIVKKEDLLELKLELCHAKLSYHGNIISLDIGDDGDGPVVAIVTDKGEAEVVRWIPE